MSKGKIVKPSKPELPANYAEQPIKDVIYSVVQTCIVEVENKEWEGADLKISEDIVEIESKIATIEKRLGDNHGNVSEEIKLLSQQITELKNRKPLDLLVTLKDKTIDLGIQHCQMPNLIKILAAGLNVYLVGPAGSGKTMAAIKSAEALGVSFHFTGAIASEFKLTGFIDAQGRIVATEFRKAYENGGLFLFDEIDASYPQAILAFNAALANNYMDFPDKRIERHKDFYCIAAANTYGQGADRQYVGRNQLDAASLDRFVFVDWKYDENLERSIAGNNDWTEYVQRIRRYIEQQKIRHIVSPRASIFGAKLLAQGLTRETVEETVIWKGLDEAVKQKIIANLYPKESINSTASGEFTPILKIGAQVMKGDLIGWVTNYNGYAQYRDHHTQEKINSPKEGKLLFVKETGKVNKGDMLAEIQLS